MYNTIGRARRRRSRPPGHRPHRVFSIFPQCHALHNKALRAPGGLAHSEVEVVGAKVVSNCPLCV